MMFPSVFGENLFDDWMDDFGFKAVSYTHLRAHETIG